MAASAGAIWLFGDAVDVMVVSRKDSDHSVKAVVEAWQRKFNVQGQSEFVDSFFGF